MKEICEELDLEVDFIRRGRRPTLPFKLYLKEKYFDAYIKSILEELKLRFGNRQQAAFSLQSLLPSHASKLSFEKIEKAVRQYSSFLENEEIEDEVQTWKLYCSSLEKKPDTVTETLTLFDKTLSLLYPNIYTLLIILATVPVSTCTVERSFSLLRHILTDFRANMLPERTSNLAILAWHNYLANALDGNKIVDIFNEKTRRVKF
uniref:HAT C-terminal dimerisation domain-containing protein n=1 Tax=Panagrolaimus superbus TaxID=310955 RepID=A0A914YB39_9BILA